MRWIVECVDDCGIEVLDKVTKKLVALNDSGLASVKPEHTCKLTDTTKPANDDFWHSDMCSSCGKEFTCAILDDEIDVRNVRFCPVCGAKVVD